LTRFFNLPSPLKLLLVSLSFSSAFLQAATLTVSDNLVIREVDDQSIEHSFLSKKSIFELKKGNHALIVRYKDVFEDLDFAQETVVESEDFVVTFIINDEQQLSLTTRAINNLASAQSFTRSPEVKLTDEHNKQLVINLVKVADYKLAKQVNIAVSALASTQIINKAHSSALSKSAEENSPKQIASTTLKSNNTLTQVNSLAMLKYWWQNASEEEKLHFKKHIELSN